MRVLHAVKGVAVKIPTAEVEGDNPAARLHQAAGHQKVLEVPGRAVTEALGVALAIPLAHPGGFLGNIECFG